MTEKGKQIAEAALALLGCGYIMGATGWVCTQARIDAQAKQYPAYADSIRKYGPKWMGKKCYDCAQLTRTAAKSVGVSLPSGATSQWKSSFYSERGTIDTLPINEAGIQLFRQKKGSTTMEHTGMSLGDGTEVEARGHAYGVVRRKITETTYTHWARFAVVADEGRRYPYIAKVNTSGTAGASIWLRPDMVDKEGGRVAKLPKGEQVEVLGEVVGSKWRNVKHEDGSGVMDAAYLLFVEELDEDDDSAPEEPALEVVVSTYNGKPITKEQASNLVDELKLTGYGSEWQEVDA